MADNSNFVRAWKEGKMKIWFILLGIVIVFFGVSIYGMQKTKAKYDVIEYGRKDKGIFVFISTDKGENTSLLYYEYTDDYGEKRKETYASKSRYEAESLIGSEVEICVYGTMSVPVGYKVNYMLYVVLLSISGILSLLLIFLSFREYF